MFLGSSPSNRFILLCILVAFFLYSKSELRNLKTSKTQDSGTSELWMTNKRLKDLGGRNKGAIDD